MTTSNEHNNAPAVPDDILARACNLAGLPYETFLKIKSYLPTAQAGTFQEPAVPQGWRLVPIEPTKEMLDAGLKRKAQARWIDGASVLRARTENLRPAEEIAALQWEAMLAATPAPAPAQEVPEINYTALIEAAFAKNRKWAQGTTGCIAFARGVEWFREQVISSIGAKPAQEVATLSLSAEDVHAAFAKNFPKTRISQAWINFAADIAQAIAARAAALKNEMEEVGLTDEEIDTIASKYMSTVGDHWCNEEAIRERHAEDFARAIIAAIRAKGAV